MLTRVQLTGLLFLAFGIAAGIATLQGTQLQFSGLFSGLSAAVTILMGVLVAFDLWLWRLPILYPWLASRPSIGGRWQGEIRRFGQSALEGPDPPIAVQVQVHQTYSEIQLTMTTSESRSELLTGTIRYNSSGSHVLVAVYLNVPRLEVRERSPIHYGALVLRVEGRRPGQLSGDYWTDRVSRGEVQLNREVV